MFPDVDEVLALIPLEFYCNSNCSYWQLCEGRLVTRLFLASRHIPPRNGNGPKAILAFEPCAFPLEGASRISRAFLRCSIGKVNHHSLRNQD